MQTLDQVPFSFAFGPSGVAQAPQQPILTCYPPPGVALCLGDWGLSLQSVAHVPGGMNARLLLHLNLLIDDWVRGRNST